jgi:hypothetical protein
LNESKSSLVIEYDKSFIPKAIKEKKNGEIDNTDIINFYEHNSVTNEEATIFREQKVNSDRNYEYEPDYSSIGYDPFSRRDDMMSPHFREDLKLSFKANNESQLSSYTPSQRKRGR